MIPPARCFTCLWKLSVYWRRYGWVFSRRFLGLQRGCRMFHERVSRRSFNEIALDPGAGLMSSNGARSSTTSSTQDSKPRIPPCPSINPTGVAFDPVKNWAYFSDAGNNTVRVYNVTPHNAVRHTRARWTDFP